MFTVSYKFIFLSRNLEQFLDNVNDLVEYGNCLSQSKDKRKLFSHSTHCHHNHPHPLSVTRTHSAAPDTLDHDAILQRYHVTSFPKYPISEQTVVYVQIESK